MPYFTRHPSRLHSWVSIQHKANISSLMNPFIFQRQPSIVLFCSLTSMVQTMKICNSLQMEKLSWWEGDEEQGPWLTWETLGPLKAEVLVLYRLEDQSSQHFPPGLSKRRAVEERLLFWCSPASLSIPQLGMLNLLSEPAPKKQAFLL